MDWETWQPGELAVLCFIIRGADVMLIRKKRGLGAGKMNAPGGRIEPGETPLAAAIRETQEEICVTPLHLEERGDLHFHFTDGYKLHCRVFVARDFEGEPAETDEAIPMWFPMNAVPYHEMWEDDQHWLPQVLAGGHFRGWFEFDGEMMQSKLLEFSPKALFEAHA
jgi:8-oxo-dGTP diphosphatase